MIYSNISTSTLNYKLYYFYLIEGSTLCAINTILTVFIIFNKNLRSQKEYIIYGANFFYNAIYSLGFAGSGALRLSVYYNEEYIPLLTPFMCVNILQNLCWWFLNPVRGVITLIDAIDRFISVTFPLKYLTLSTRYSWMMISIPIFVSIPFFVTLEITTYLYGNIYTVPITCNNIDSPSIPYITIIVRLVLTFIAVLFYIPILIQIYKIVLSKSVSNINNTQTKKLIRANLTIGLIMANELIMSFFPDFYLYVIGSPPNPYPFYAMILNKGFVNIIIVAITQRDLRQEIKGLFWKSNNNTMVFYVKPVTTQPTPNMIS